MSSENSKATLIGAIAVLMWAALAPLTATVATIPPLEILAITFGISFFAGLTWLLVSGGPKGLGLLIQPFPYLSYAAASLFGYHALYFVALSLAPAAQASLTAYLWPLLIVLLSTLIGNHTRIKAAQILGVILGFMGTALLVATKDDHHVVMPYRIFGLAAAFACALIWSSYSVLNRRFRDVPSQAMVGVCGIVALLGWGTHCLIDSVTVVHFMLSQLLAMFALGIGPVGLAFLAWDYGTKRGDIRLLGTISYAAPVLSTVSLVILGYSTATLNLAVACVLVVGGASIATTTTRTHGQEFAQ